MTTTQQYNDYSQLSMAAYSSKLGYRTLVALRKQQLVTDDVAYRLTPGMQVSAEIKLGERTILEYLLSPVSKAFHEAWRER